MRFDCKANCLHEEWRVTWFWSIQFVDKLVDKFKECIAEKEGEGEEKGEDTGNLQEGQLVSRLNCCGAIDNPVRGDYRRSSSYNYGHSTFEMGIVSDGTEYIDNYCIYSSLFESHKWHLGSESFLVPHLRCVSYSIAAWHVEYTSTQHKLGTLWKPECHTLLLYDILR